MLPGFSFREAMSGSYWLLDAPTDERAIALALEAYAPDIRRFALDKTCRLRGTLDAERLAAGRVLEGLVAFKLLDEGRVPYRVAFTGDDGKRYELSGQKEWSSLAPLESITLLPATLYDTAGEELGRATLRFDLRSDWARWMKSFRILLTS
jgi:hypothetical protein